MHFDKYVSVLLANHIYPLPINKQTHTALIHVSLHNRSTTGEWRYFEVDCLSICQMLAPLAHQLNPVCTASKLCLCHQFCGFYSISRCIYLIRRCFCYFCFAACWWLPCFVFLFFFWFFGICEILYLTSCIFILLSQLNWVISFSQRPRFFHLHSVIDKVSDLMVDGEGGVRAVRQSVWQTGFVRYAG